MNIWDPKRIKWKKSSSIYKVVILIKIYNFGFWSFFDQRSFENFKFQILRTSNKFLVPQLISNEKVIN